MVKPETDPDERKTSYAYDPHIDPALQFDSSRSAIEALIDDALGSGDESSMRAALEELKRLQSPYLNWTGKAERTSFEIDTVSLHVHERIDPATILSAVRKRIKEGKSKGAEKAMQPDLFAAPFENLPLRDAFDFYKHEKGWSNRLIAGDSLLVMNSLLQKESMAGQVQMIYIDPPYGIKYGSNFQPFTNKRDVKDRSDADLTQEPEMIKAFRDTWELGIHSYLTYLRDRLMLARELLTESGSVFVQISDENLHLVRQLMDEVFGAKNFVTVIAYRTSGSLGSDVVSGIFDLIIWYAKDRNATKINQLFVPREPETYQFDMLPGGYWKRIAEGEEPQDPFTTENLVSSGYTESCIYDFEFGGRSFSAASGKSWKTTRSGVETLQKANRIIATGATARYLLKFNDYPVMRLTNLWADMTGATDKMYAVQTSQSAIQRCMLMASDPGDLVFDPTCGSGTTAFVAEKWGRRWITCDTSRVAITLAKQRLMTSSFDYYALR